MEQILFELLRNWPGALGRADPALVEDSLVLLPLLGEARSLIDVGSGGGLPGLPLKLARPELQVTLLEASHRKAALLVQLTARLGLSGVEVVADRAELAGHQPRHREAYDLATARALAALPVVAELCLPFVRVGGRLLAMRTARDDVDAALVAFAEMGGRLHDVVPAASTARARGTVVMVDKIEPTPVRYPRRPGVPARRPLGKL
jgi:16S rRNA (guanine527-N7)-methyltransferase